MTQLLKTTLLIPTYNWPESLEMILISVSNQSQLPDEVLIADDGSTDATKKLINKYQSKFPIKLIHIWHEDKGFRKSSILNKAIAISKSDYIIQIDGDCFLHPKFIEDHLRYAQRAHYLFGIRVRISERCVPKVLKNKNTNISFFHYGLKKRLRNIRIPFIPVFFKSENELSHKLRGCNMSFWKDDFIAINGYNEDLEGWGREDSELAIRLHNNKLLGKRLKFCAIVYHLDHKENKNDEFDLNDIIQNKTISHKTKFCVNGIDKYLNLKTN